MGTDSLTGTTPDRFSHGLDSLGIEHEHLFWSVEDLKDWLDTGWAALRTITGGIPHWVIADDWDGSRFHIADPAGGEYWESERETDARWQKRNYEAYKIPRKSSWKRPVKVETAKHLVQPLAQGEIPEAFEIAVEAFGHLMAPQAIRGYLSSSVTQGLSAGLWEKQGDRKGRMIGTYLLRRVNSLSGHWAGLSTSSGATTGAEGIALALAPHSRGHGLSHLLRAYATRSAGGFLVGQHLHGLDNREHWLKRRQVIGETDEGFLTMEEAPFTERETGAAISPFRPAAERPVIAIGI